MKKYLFVVAAAIVFSTGVIQAQEKQDANLTATLSVTSKPTEPDASFILFPSSPVQKTSGATVALSELGAEAPVRQAKPNQWTTGNAQLDGLIRMNGARYRVDPYLIYCVMTQESAFNSRAVSRKGARGLMQLMPQTAARFGVRNPRNPAESIRAGSQYLRLLLDKFGGRVDLALAGYNAGEGNVYKYGMNVPPFRETQAYVRLISGHYDRASHRVETGATNR